MRSKEFIILLRILEELKVCIESSRTSVADEILINSDQMEKLLKNSHSHILHAPSYGCFRL